MESDRQVPQVPADAPALEDGGDLVPHLGPSSFPRPTVEVLVGQRGKIPREKPAGLSAGDYSLSELGNPERHL
jgi:hypothetical protein